MIVEFLVTYHITSDLERLSDLVVGLPVTCFSNPEELEVFIPVTVEFTHELSEYLGEFIYFQKHKTIGICQKELVLLVRG